jgi:hypothetical protein
MGLRKAKPFQQRRAKGIVEPSSATLIKIFLIDYFNFLGWRFLEPSDLGGDIASDLILTESYEVDTETGETRYGRIWFHANPEKDIFDQLFADELIMREYRGE